MDFNFYRNKKILVTGHTGFKGTWLCEILYGLGAKVSGYALEPPTNPSLFSVINMSERMESYIGDIRDLEKLHEVFVKVQPVL